MLRTAEEGKTRLPPRYQMADTSLPACPVYCLLSTVSRLQQFFADPLRLKTRLERLSFSSVQKEASR